MDAPRYLFTARTTNGTSDPVPLTLRNAGEFIYNTIFLYGTWDSATVDVEWTPDNGATWLDVPDLVAIDDNFSGNIHVRADAIRAVVANAGAGTVLTIGVK